MAIKKSSSKAKSQKHKTKKPKKKKPSLYPKRSLELPKNTTLRKLPPKRPNLPPKYSASAKIVYISRKTPFISAVKRVRKHLDVFEKQNRSSTLQHNKGKMNITTTINYKTTGSTAKPSSSKAAQKKKNNEEETNLEDEKVVIIRATGRAIEKAMGLGLYFQGQDDVDVQLQTGTVECVDEVVQDTSKLGLQDLLKPDALARLKSPDDEAEMEEADIGNDDKMGEVDIGDGDKMDFENEDEDEEEEIEEVSEDEILDDSHPNRTRFTSMLEIIIRKKELMI